MNYAKKNRGVALITAMLIMAVTASLATTLAWNNALDVRRTMVLLFHEQGVQIAMGAESWIRNILRDDSIDSPTDHLGELWASELPGLPVDSDTVQGIVIGNVEDLNGRFNVNNLLDSNGAIDQDMFEQFQRLLQALDLDPRFAGIMVDWIDADQNAEFPDGAEDSIYTGLTPNYRAYNRPLSNVTEIAALDGMDKASYDILIPHIAALPGRTLINVNTATAAVLRSLDANMDQSTVEQLITEREEAGFADYIQSFQGLLSPQMINNIGETSEYFQLKAVVQIDTVRVTYFSIMKRAPDGGGVTTIVRSLGTI